MYRKITLLVAISFLVFGCKGRTTTNIVAHDGTLQTVETKRQPPVEVIIEKQFLYDQHTLEDTYPYKDGTREFQWDKIKDTLTLLESAQRTPIQWATLQNYKNQNGIAPVVEEWEKDEYNSVTDEYGVSRYQSIPLYDSLGSKKPIRYARDGSVVKFLKDTLDYMKICSMTYDGEWYVPVDYVKVLETPVFNHVIFVDRTNQNITTLEKEDGKWLVRSMNPATTGLHRPPYQQETPLGTFVIQEKRRKMFYLHDGSSEMAGYAPYASRFTRGGYIHGVPLNNPNATERDEVELSPTLGTTPRSHMCVRNATSHAKFIYDTFPPLESLVVVIE